MKGRGLVQYYFPWTAQPYYYQVLAFTNKRGLRLVDQTFVKAITYLRVIAASNVDDVSGKNLRTKQQDRNRIKLGKTGE